MTHVSPEWRSVEPSPVAYWRTIVRHRWAVLTVFLLSVLAALVWGIAARPIFSATALLRVDREEPRVLKFDQVVREDGELPQIQLQTFQRLLQSRTLANRVIDLLGLDRHPEFQEFHDRREELTSAFLSRLEGVFDMIAVDRLVNQTGRAVYVMGDWGRSIQTGRLRNYLMFLTVALVGLFAGVFAWIRR